VSVHIVSEGETIESIAARYGVSTADLLALNNLADADFIYPGQELRLPPGAVDSQAGGP
jgi:LysM repeat protein